MTMAARGGVKALTTNANVLLGGHPVMTSAMEGWGAEGTGKADEVKQAS